MLNSSVFTSGPMLLDPTVRLHLDFPFDVIHILIYTKLKTQERNLQSENILSIKNEHS